MAQKHKGDRARLTCRLPRPLVARVDACTRIPKGADRNDRIEALLEVALDALESTESPGARPLRQAADLLEAIAVDAEDRALVGTLRRLAATT